METGGFYACVRQSLALYLVGQRTRRPSTVGITFSDCDVVPDNALFSCRKRAVSTVKVVWKKVDNFPARVVGV